jgi:hypothetical protein
MKKYLLPHGVNWYRANMHCHTTISDGSLTPEQVKEAYKNHGYSIVAYTDHEILLDHSDLNDENFLAITSSEYSINEGASFFKVLSEKDGKNWRLRKTIHMNIFSKNPHNEFQPAANEDTYAWIQNGKYKGVEGKCDGYRRIYTKESINEVIRRCNEAGFLVQFNHPYWSLNEEEDYLGLEGLWSLEILNYATDRVTGADYCPGVYDEMVRSGMHNLYCSMGDDNHNRGGSLDHSFGGSTIIGAKELEYGQIMDALEKGEFYCASGRDNPPQIKELYVEDNKVIVECSPAVSVYYNGYCRTFKFVDQKDENGLTRAEFPIESSDVFFRITVRDKFGNVAHTHYYNVQDCLEEKDN